MNYLLILTKLVIGFFSLLVLLNWFGNRNLSPMSSTDQIYNYVLGGIIGGSIYNENVSVSNFLIIMIIWGVLIKLLDIVKTHSHRIRLLIDGKPLVIFEHNEFHRKNLKKANMSVQDFYHKIRLNGIFSISELKYVEIQKNGQLLILTKDSPDIALLLISDGKLNTIELERANLTRQELMTVLKKENIKSISSVHFCEYLDGKFYIKKN